MSEEVKKSVGNDNLGASAGASVGTEVTDTSVSAGAQAGAEAHAGVENTDTIGDFELKQEAHADVEQVLEYPLEHK